MRVLVSAVFLGAALAFASGSAWSEEVHSAAPRTRSEVERVIDKNKGGLYALYSRALRDKPGLRGKIVLSYAIGPDGTVTKCSVVSSTLDDRELENGIVRRFSSINFGAKGTTVYADSWVLTLVSAL